MTGYLFKRNDDEITNIAGVFTAVIFIVSLVLAPWPIQFGLLMFVVGSAGFDEALRCLTLRSNCFLFTDFKIIIKISKRLTQLKLL